MQQKKVGAFNALFAAGSPGPREWPKNKKGDGQSEGSNLRKGRLKRWARSARRKGSIHVFEVIFCLPS